VCVCVLKCVEKVAPFVCRYQPGKSPIGISPEQPFSAPFCSPPVKMSEASNARAIAQPSAQQLPTFAEMHTQAYYEQEKQRMHLKLAQMQAKLQGVAPDAQVVQQNRNWDRQLQKQRGIQRFIGYRYNEPMLAPDVVIVSRL
jgi:hypothetical protein